MEKTKGDITGPGQSCPPRKDEGGRTSLVGRSTSNGISTRVKDSLETTPRTGSRERSQETLVVYVPGRGNDQRMLIGPVSGQRGGPGSDFVSSRWRGFGDQILRKCEVGSFILIETFDPKHSSLSLQFLLSTNLFLK